MNIVDRLKEAVVKGDEMSLTQDRVKELFHYEPEAQDYPLERIHTTSTRGE